MANWRDFLSGGSATKSSLRFRPRLDTLDGRLVPSSNPGNPPPDQPPADPGPGQPYQVSYGEPMYFADGAGNITELVLNADGSFTTTSADSTSPTGFTAITFASNAAPVSAAGSQPRPQVDPIPPFGAGIGGLVVPGGIQTPIPFKEPSGLTWNVTWGVLPGGPGYIRFQTPDGSTFTQYSDGNWAWEQPGKEPIFGKIGRNQQQQ